MARCVRKREKVDNALTELKVDQNGWNTECRRNGEGESDDIQERNRL